MFSTNINYQILYIEVMNCHCIVTKKDGSKTDPKIVRINGITAFDTIERAFKNIYKEINEDNQYKILFEEINEMMNFFDKEIICEFSSKEEFEFNAAEYLI